MSRREDPVRAPRPKRSETVRHGHCPPSAERYERGFGAAVQLAAVHRALRHGSVPQLAAGGTTSSAGGVAGPDSANRTGLPDRLKTGVESLSGIALDDVKVHYNSPKPAALQAHAYAQGADIHLAPGQEQHLPHEAWHVVQQKQGRVKPTLQMKGVAINDEAELEREADVMGARAAAATALPDGSIQRLPASLAVQRREVVQREHVDTILNLIDQNRETLGPVTGVHTKRLMYWDAQGLFDQGSGRKLDMKALKKYMAKKIPSETEKVDESKLPDFMKVRSEFSTQLPGEFGGARLWFRKHINNVLFKGRGWISDNVYWRAEKSKARYMVHAILEWAGQKKGEDKPEPHMTIRDAETQVKIELDKTSPNLDRTKRIKGTEASDFSFARGLGQGRDKGKSMKDDEETFDILGGEKTKAWLEALVQVADKAVTP